MATATLSALPGPIPLGQLPETQNENAPTPGAEASEHPDPPARALNVPDTAPLTAAPPALEDTAAPLWAASNPPTKPRAPSEERLVRQPVPLERVPERLRLKGRACRWLCEHGFTTDEGALQARYELLDQGRAEACYLWMFNADVVNPYASAALGELAAAFEVAAASLSAWLAPPEHAPETELTQLLDEVQGALRTAVTAVRTDAQGGFWFDEDQRAIFEALRRYGAERRVYLPYLNRENHPDPAASAQRAAALAALLERAQNAKARATATQRALNQLSYHVKRLSNRPHQPDHEWSRLAGAVDRLLELGVQESDLALREHLAPVATLLPETTPHTRLSRVLKVRDTSERAKAERLRVAKESVRRRTGQSDEPSVREVAGLLAGRTVVLIGGEPRPDATQQLETAFRCRVDWPNAPKHASPDIFKPNIRRNEVGVVLLLIRWSSHVFGELEPFCREHGKPLVRVTGGYNPKSLARAILEQGGERLRGRLA